MTPQERHFMQKLNFKNNVSETLLINVYMRHLDFKDADPILNDPFSSAVVEQIDYDFAKFDDAHLSKTGHGDPREIFRRRDAAARGGA